MPPELHVERPFHGAVFLRHFDRPLTYFHNALFCCSPEMLDQLFGSLVRAIGDRSPPARLHADDVLVLRSTEHVSELANSLQKWLDECGFSSETLHRCYHIESTIPVEDGFFSCLCVIESGSTPPPVKTVKNASEWVEARMNKNSAAQVLVEFITDELQRLGGDSGQHILDDLYAWYQSPTQSMHRCFDPEWSAVEFAASVWSANELRIWSRPVQYPK